MPTQCNSDLFGFSRVEGRSVVAAFDGGAVTSDAGPLPVSAADGWSTYTGDHLALLDGLGVDRCHLLGGCSGGPYSLGVMQAAPERVAAAVLQQPIGYDGQNREAFYDMFDGWADGLRSEMPDVPDEAWTSFRSNLYDADFVFSVDR